MRAPTCDDLDQITQVLRDLGKISAEIQPDEDFYEAGFSSINSLELLLELETRFEVSLPDDRFIEARTPQAIVELIHDILQGKIS